MKTDLKTLDKLKMIKYMFVTEVKHLQILIFNVKSMFNRQNCENVEVAG